MLQQNAAVSVVNCTFLRGVSDVILFKKIKEIDMDIRCWRNNALLTYLKQKLLDAPLAFVGYR
jgi:hypothetical protein